MSKKPTQKKYEAVAEAKKRNAIMTARKARLVLDLIRGKSVDKALEFLAFTNKPSSCTDIINGKKSVVSMAEKKGVNDAGELIITDAFADGAGMLKRLRPAPMGRGVRVRKRSCHITIRLNEAKEA